MDTAEQHYFAVAQAMVAKFVSDDVDVLEQYYCTRLLADALFTDTVAWVNEALKFTGWGPLYWEKNEDTHKLLLASADASPRMALGLLRILTYQSEQHIAHGLTMSRLQKSFCSCICPFVRRTPEAAKRILQGSSLLPLFFPEEAPCGVGAPSKKRHLEEDE